MMDKSYTKPIIVIGSTSNTKPKSLIKLLTGDNILQEDESVEIRHPWKIDTKYYTADVDIYGISTSYSRADQFNDSVEALVIHMDTNKESGLDDLKSWLTVEEDCDPEIKLLICNYCTSDTKITKGKAIEWCLKRGFELIELYPNVSNEHDHSDDEDELIKEKFGVDRIVEALQAHVWSNLVMKNQSESDTYVGSNINFSSDNSTSNNEPIDANLGDDMFGQFVQSDEIDDFNELFSQLHMIKESMKSLPASQRKQCAEHMVTAFWHAIGGDEEELGDL